MKSSSKYSVAKVSVTELDKLIMPARDINACSINLRSSLVYQIGQFAINLGLVHKYKQQSRTFGSRVPAWKTVFQAKTGKRLLVTEDQLFTLYNYSTTNQSRFGNLIRIINDRSSDEWNARYFYDVGHSLTSINMPYRDTCFKYCHRFPKRLKTSCPGCGSCHAERACSCSDRKCGGAKQCRACDKKKCTRTFCH